MSQRNFIQTGSVHKRLSAPNPDRALVFYNGIQDYFNAKQPLLIVQGCNLVSAERLYKSLQRSFIGQHGHSITNYTKSICTQGIFIHFHRSAHFEMVNLHILGGPNIFIQHPKQRSLKQDQQQFSAFIKLKLKLHSTKQFCPCGLLSVNDTPAMGGS